MTHAMMRRWLLALGLIGVLALAGAIQAPWQPLHTYAQSSPSADAGGNNGDGTAYFDIEGQPALILNAGGSIDPDGDALQYRWDIDGDGSWDTGWSDMPGYAVNWTDDYTGTVRVEVSDGISSDIDTAPVTILNATPFIDETTMKATPNPARVGETVEVKALFKDPGTSDTHETTTFDWGDGSAQTLATISTGTLPGDHKASAIHAYLTPGVYEVTLTVIDDDGGQDQATITVVVVGNADLMRTIGYWKHQIGGNGNQHIDDATLEAYIGIVNAKTKVFSEHVALNTLEDATSLLWLQHASMEERAIQQFLASWLNFANGAVAMDQLVDTDYDGLADAKFKDAMFVASEVIINGDNYELAKDICDSINNMGQ